MQFHSTIIMIIKYGGPEHVKLNLLFQKNVRL